MNNACQTCHKAPEDELISRVHTIQDRTHEMRDIAIDAVLELTKGIAAAAEDDASADRVSIARGYQRKAQFFTPAAV